MSPARHDGRVSEPASSPASRTAKRDGRARMTGKERREQLLDIGRSLFAEKGFDAHVRRGDRAQRRRVQASRLRALRRQGRPVRRRGRPRDEQAARRPSRGPDQHGQPAPAARAGRLGAARLRRGSPATASASWSATRRSAQATGSFASLISDIATPGRAHPGRRVQGARLRPEARPDVRPDARRHGRAHRAVVAGRAQARARPRSRRTWSTSPGTGSPDSKAHRPSAHAPNSPAVSEGTVRVPTRATSDTRVLAGASGPRRRFGGTGSTVPKLSCG